MRPCSVAHGISTPLKLRERNFGPRIRLGLRAAAGVAAHLDSRLGSIGRTIEDEYAQIRAEYRTDYVRSSGASLG